MSALLEQQAHKVRKVLKDPKARKEHKDPLDHRDRKDLKVSRACLATPGLQEQLAHKVPKDRKVLKG
jgi:hypothetical protein